MGFTSRPSLNHQTRNVKTLKRGKKEILLPSENFSGEPEKTLNLCQALKYSETFFAFPHLYLTQSFLPLTWIAGLWCCLK